MEIEEYARIAAAEDHHWWYRNTRGVMADLLTPWLGSPGTAVRRILDAGCGPGGNGAWLAEHGRVFGVDLAPEALELVQARRAEVTPARASVDALPFTDASFDAVVEITVLCCVEDHERAIGELARVARAGAPVLVMEPAFDALRREHDVTVHARRRYRRGELARLMQARGLTVRRSTYAYSFLAPPAAALGLAARLRRRPPEGHPSDVEKRGLDPAFARLADVERRLLRRRDVPFGTSVVLLATRDT